MLFLDKKIKIPLSPSSATALDRRLLPLTTVANHYRQLFDRHRSLFDHHPRPSSPTIKGIFENIYNIFDNISVNQT